MNVPLKAGIGDAAYVELFTQVVSGIVTRYSPQAVVLQWYHGNITRHFSFLISYFINHLEGGRLMMFFSSAPVVLTGSLATLSADSTSPYGTACAPAPANAGSCPPQLMVLAALGVASGRAEVLVNVSARCGICAGAAGTSLCSCWAEAATTRPTPRGLSPTSRPSFSTRYCPRGMMPTLLVTRHVSPRDHHGLCFSRDCV